MQQQFYSYFMSFDTKNTIKTDLSNMHQISLLIGRLLAIRSA